MLLYYHKDLKGNFGDDLNPWLWDRLLPGFFRGDFPHEPKLRQTSPGGETLFIGIGTLLNRNIPQTAKKIVFGSGAGYGPPPTIDGSWDISCVRGPLTAAMLGLARSMAVTDPAVLVRAINFQRGPKTRRISYMPHCSSARNFDWSRICERVGIGFIDPQQSVEEVLRGICSTEILITEAMHGAIVADALRIPWLPVATSPAILELKWHDWCQSLGLQYKPAKMPALWRLGDKPSPSARLRSAVKTVTVHAILRQIIRKGIPLLSADARMEQATDELKERLARLQQRYGAASERPLTPIRGNDGL